jgi:hypothetical protein
MWTGLVWLRIGAGVELLWIRYWTLGFHKMLQNYRVSKQQGISRVVLSSMELVSYVRHCRQLSVRFRTHQIKYFYRISPGSEHWTFALHRGSEMSTFSLHHGMPAATSASQGSQLCEEGYTLGSHVCVEAQGTRLFSGWRTSTCVWMSLSWLYPTRNLFPSQEYVSSPTVLDIPSFQIHSTQTKTTKYGQTCILWFWSKYHYWYHKHVLFNSEVSTITGTASTDDEQCNKDISAVTQ